MFRGGYRTHSSRNSSAISSVGTGCQVGSLNDPRSFPFGWRCSGNCSSSFAFLCSFIFFILCRATYSSRESHAPQAESSPLQEDVVIEEEEDDSSPACSPPARELPWARTRPKLTNCQVRSLSSRRILLLKFLLCKRRN